MANTAAPRTIADPQDFEDIPVSSVVDDFEDMHPPPAPAASPPAASQQPPEPSGMLEKLSHALDNSKSLRAGISNFQQTGDPAAAAGAAYSNFSGPAYSNVPSWTDVMAKTGVPTQDVDTHIPHNPLASPFMNPFEARSPPQETYKVSPAEAAGGVMGVVTDPVNYAMGPLESLAKALGLEVAPTLGKLATKSAFKQGVGDSLANIKKAQGLGSGALSDSLTRGAEKVENIGGALLAHDEADAAIKEANKAAGKFAGDGTVLSPSVRDTALNAGYKRKFYGEKIGAVQDAIDKVEPAAVKGQNIADKLTATAEGYKVNGAVPPSSQGAYDAVMKEADFFKNAGDMSFAKASELKNKTYTFDPKKPGAAAADIPLNNMVNRTLSTEMEETADRLASKLPSDVADKYPYYKEKYADYLAAERGATAHAIATMKPGVAAGTKESGLLGLMAMAAGGHTAASSMLAGMGAGALKALAKHAGPFVAARGLKTAADLAPATGKLVIPANIGRNALNLASPWATVPLAPANESP